MTVLVSGGAARARRVLGPLAWLTLAGLAALAGTARPGAPQTPAHAGISGDPFIIKPYLQLGDVPKLAPSETVRVLWQSANEPTAKWSVDVRQRDGEPVASGHRDRRPARSAAETPYRLFNVPLTRLEPGAEFEYRVSRNGQVVFAAKGKARAVGRATVSFRRDGRHRREYRSGAADRPSDTPRAAGFLRHRRRHRVFDRPDGRVPREVLSDLQRGRGEP